MELEEAVSKAKRQSGIITTRNTTTSNFTQPGNLTKNTHSIKLFVLGMQSMLTKLEQEYLLDNIAEEAENELTYKELIPQEIQRAGSQNWRLEAGVPGIEKRKATKPGMHTRTKTSQDTSVDQNRQYKSTVMVERDPKNETIVAVTGPGDN